MTPRQFYALLALLIAGGVGGWAVHNQRTAHRPPVLATPASGEKDVPTAPPHRMGVVPATSSVYVPASGCGVERWSVKTLTDPGANSVDQTPKDTTVAALDALPAPVGPTDRVAPVETSTWRITAHADAFKQEADSDVHLAVHDNTGASMIVEFPSSSCDQGSVVAAQIKSARDAFVARFGQPTNAYQPVSGDVTLSGVGFFDRIHGQRGVAPNGIELHPVTSCCG